MFRTTLLMIAGSGIVPGKWRVTKVLLYKISFYSLIK